MSGRADDDQVERLLAKLEIPRNGFRLLDISISPVETHQTGRSVTFVLNERYTVNFHAPTLLEALRMADQAIWEAGCSATPHTHRRHLRGLRSRVLTISRPGTLDAGKR